MKTCLYCHLEIQGRVDKKFCDSHCKSSYHYEKEKRNKPHFYSKVDKQLKLNRRVLKTFNKSGKSIIREEKLLNSGFNPKFFTHYWKNKKGEIYLFCYEFGFIKKIEGSTKKYVLVHWQDYMISNF